MAAIKKQAITIKEKIVVLKKEKHKPLLVNIFSFACIIPDLLVSTSFNKYQIEFPYGVRIIRLPLY